MNTIPQDDTLLLETAHRLMQAEARILARRSGKPVDEHTSDNSAEELPVAYALPPGKSIAQKTAEKLEAIDIRLRDLIQQLENLDTQPAPIGETNSATVITSSQTEISIRLRVLSKIEGLIANGRHSTETDRYLFEFVDGTTFRITDKYTGRITTIWGDPHVDTDDQEGDRNGEFSDLQASDTHTTMLLQDGSRVTFTARDQGVIERVDVFLKNQHAWGFGAGSGEPEEKQLFRQEVLADGATAAAELPAGDSVRVGGDGNDWFTMDGKQIWGKTTGPIVRERPNVAVEMEYRHEETQTIVQRAA